MNKFIFSILFINLAYNYVLGQSYKKDSLQIKVYTLADFEHSKLKNIKISKIFCDYCSKSQLKAIEGLAIKMSHKKIRNSKNRLENGQKKLTLNIRVKKEDIIGYK